MYTMKSLLFEVFDFGIITIDVPLDFERVNYLGDFFSEMLVEGEIR